MSLLTRSNLVYALYLSFLANIKLARHHKTADWCFQGYTAYKWFLTRIALERIDGHFYIAEHYDRWAVLADRVVASAKHNKKLHLVQHGVVQSLENTTQLSKNSLKLHYKLNHINSMFLYDICSKNIFFSEFLSPHLKAEEVTVTYYQPKITLAPRIDNNKMHACLFVGHPICEELQIAMYNLLKPYDIYCYYKPHPTAKRSERITEQSWLVIDKPDFFPTVDFLISYPSTLVQEYKGQGVGVILHAINDQLNIPLFLASVAQKLNSLQNVSSISAAQADCNISKS